MQKPTKTDSGPEKGQHYTYTRFLKIEGGVRVHRPESASFLYSIYLKRRRLHSDIAAPEDLASEALESRSNNLRQVDYPYWIKSEFVATFALVWEATRLLLKPKKPKLSGNALHLGRIMLFVLTPEEVDERLGDLLEARVKRIAPNWGEWYSHIWLWVTCLKLVACTAIKKAAPLVSKVKALWDTPSKG